ncbi:MAG: spore germination protein [Oscillospiraceae bacterium]|nr:spore germination protein [Oscillospiraceae bacterium]
MLSPHIEDTLSELRRRTLSSADLLANRVMLGGVSCCLLACEGLCAADTLGKLVLEPLNSLPPQKDGAALLAFLRDYRLLSADRPVIEDSGTLLTLLYSGFAVLLAEGAVTALGFGIQGYAARGISEPSGELNIYGAKEGFTEPLRINMSMIRRRMKSPRLTFELHTAGTVTQTELCICWLSDRVPQELLDRIRAKLDTLPLESVFSAGYVRPFLEETDTKLIHSIGTTERPDIFCAKLLEGRVGILIDGTPFALTLPQLFCETFQTLDDYNYPPAYATLLRWLKYGAGLIALLLPALYLAAALWHPALLNETLLRLLTESEANAPFSLTAELLGILFMYEIVREAGLRLPKAVGGAVGIIGGLLIGDAAVESGLISTPVLTVAALSATAGFVIPEHHAALTVVRPLMILAAAAFGMAGIAVLGTMLLFHICATEIFGFPVSAPIAPLMPHRLHDLLARVGFRRLSQGNFRVEEVRR